MEPKQSNRNLENFNLFDSKDVYFKSALITNYILFEKNVI